MRLFWVERGKNICEFVASQTQQAQGVPDNVLCCTTCSCICALFFVLFGYPATCSLFSEPSTTRVLAHTPQAFHCTTNAWRKYCTCWHKMDVRIWLINLCARSHPPPKTPKLCQNHQGFSNCRPIVHIVSDEANCDQIVAARHISFLSHSINSWHQHTFYLHLLVDINFTQIITQPLCLWAQLASICEVIKDDDFNELDGALTISWNEATMQMLSFENITIEINGGKWADWYNFLKKL